MSGYKRTLEKTIDFGEDKVRIRFKRLKRDQFMTLQPFIEETQGGKVEMSFESQNSLFELIEELLPKCLTKLSGLTVDDEEYVYDGSNTEDFMDLITEAYFMPLIEGMLTSIMVESMPKSDGKSVKKSNNTSKESSKE